MSQAIGQQLEQATKVVEQCVDAEIERLDNLEPDDIEKLRAERLRKMKALAEKKKKLLEIGHGEYQELKDEKEFFEEVRKSERVVCHFYRESTFRCKIVDKHLHDLASKHIETRFLKIDAERSRFLCDRLKVKVLPTMVLIMDSKTKDYIVGFDDLGGIDEFPTEMLEWRLGMAGIIDYSGERPDITSKTKPKSVFEFARKSDKSIRGKEESDDDDDY